MDEVKIGCDKSRGLSFFAELVSEHNQNGQISMERETFDIHTSYSKFKQA